MANLLDQASIVLTPTAYDDGKVLCAKPSEPPYGDFDFSRNSAATRVNAQGLVENVQILSSNLVQNGDFSEEGVQEVSNGSFSQEGSELVVNGDFATDSDWTADYGASQSDITISNGELSFISSATYGFAKQQINVTSGKIYKITADIKSFSGSMRLFSSSGNAAKTINSTGIITNYFTPIDATTLIGFSANNDIGASVVCNSISCVEVGQNWILGTGWSIGEDKAVANTTGSTNGLLQTSAITSGKIYKATFEVLDYQGGSVRINLGGAGLTGVGNLVSANGVYTQYITSDGVDVYMQGRVGFNGSITNISVKEVGQNWDLGDGWSISDGKAVAVSGVSSKLTQSISGLSGKKCSVTFTLSNYGGSGNIKLDFGSVVGQNRNANGTYTEVGTYDIDRFEFFKNAGFEGSITNISVIEITDDTNLPRINYEGFSYQDALGSELITNGGFDTDSDWLKNSGWTISGGTANTDGTINSKIQQSNVATIGKTYKYSFDVLNSSAGTLSGRFRTGSGTVLPISSEGTFSGYFVATSDNVNVTTLSDNSATFSIDNVSVKEYLGQEVVPDSGCGSWLFEPQSTNLITYSEDFSDSSWSKNAISETSGFTSPSGDNSAFKISGTGGSSYHNIRTSISTTNSTVSCFVKKGTLNHFEFIDTIGGSPYSVVQYNLEEVTANINVAGVFLNPKIEDYGNGWYRCSAEATATASIHFNISKGSTDGTGLIEANDYLYIWGAQLEQQSYATSYIPTSGTSVTRNQDVCNNGGSLASINSTEGVLYAEIAKNSLSNNNQISISLSSGSTNNRVMFFYGANDQRITCQVRSNGSTSYSSGFDLSAGSTNFNKIAIKYKENDFSFWVNGSKINQATTGVTPLGLNQLAFDVGAISNNFFGKTKALAVFKEALSDAELADLTYPTPTDPTFALDFDTIATDFTFARGSEATYVDAQGLIQSTNELGPEEITNGDFATDSDWIKGTGITISNGQANFTGVSGQYLSQDMLTSGKSYKLTFNVTDYTSGTLTIFGGSGNNISSIFPVNSTGIYTGIFISGGTNNRLYFGSTFIGSIDNVSVKEYITETNTPRIDYSTGTEAFLLEPQSTNLITYSEDFSNAVWVKINSSVASGFASPSGNTNAYKLIASVSNTDHRTRTAPIPTAAVGTTVTFSIYIKPQEITKIALVDNWTNLSYGVVNLTTNSVIEEAQGTTSVTEILNGFRRVSFTYQTANINTLPAVYLLDDAYTSGNPTSYTFSSDGTSGVYIWGAQLEKQSYATSYIPTSGTTVTRNQETCINATPEINSEEGTLYFEGSALANGGLSRYIALSNGSNNERVQIIYSSTANYIVMNVVTSNSVQAQFTVTVPQTQYNKLAISYKANDVSFWLNGIKVHTDTNATMPIGLNVLEFQRPNNTSSFFGNTKDVQVYTKALSDAELIKLTT